MSKLGQTAKSGGGGRGKFMRGREREWGRGEKGAEKRRREGEEESER